MRKIIIGLSILTLMIILGCGDKGSSGKGQVKDLGDQLTPKPRIYGEIEHVAIDSAFTQVGEYFGDFDPDVSHDGNGSLRFDVQDSMLVHVTTLDDVDVDMGRFYYRAWLKTANFTGKVYLEMRLRFGTTATYYTRDQYSPLEGTKDWELHDCYLLLGEGQNPTEVELQINVDGKGTVWIDDISLVRAPFRPGDLREKYDSLYDKQLK